MASGDDSNRRGGLSLVVFGGLGGEAPAPVTVNPSGAKRIKGTLCILALNRNTNVLQGNKITISVLIKIERMEDRSKCRREEKRKGQLKTGTPSH